MAGHIARCLNMVDGILARFWGLNSDDNEGFAGRT